MRKRGFLCLFCASLFCCCHAQQGKDFLLTLRKDTLFGKIIMGVGKAPITFIHQKQKLTFYPTTIRSFGVFKAERYKIYETLRSEEGNAIFVEVVAQGKVNLYKYVEKRIAANTIQDRYVYFLGKSKAELSVLSSSNYRRILGTFFEEYPDLLVRLEDIDFEDVPYLMKVYNRLEHQIKN